MRRPLIALATGADWPELDEDSSPLVPALRERGIDVELPVWTDASVAWERYDAVIVRSVWDYFDRPAEFEAWIDRDRHRSVTVLGTCHARGQLVAQAEGLFMRVDFDAVQRRLRAEAEAEAEGGAGGSPDASAPGSAG